MNVEQVLARLVDAIERHPDAKALAEMQMVAGGSLFVVTITCQRTDIHYLHGLAAHTLVRRYPNVPVSVVVVPA